MTDISGKPVQSPVQKAVTWGLIACFFGALALMAAGLVVRDYALQGIGIGVLLAAIVIANLRAKRQAATDPALARRMQEARVKVRARQEGNFRVQLISALIAVVVVTAAMLFKKFAPGFSTLPKSDQRLYLMGGAIMVIVLGNLAWMAWKKRRGA